MTDRARRRVKASAPADSIAAGTPSRRRPIAFWLHQLLEYLLATGLVVLSVHIGRSDLLLVGGVIFGLLALTARGPLGIVRVCGPRLHLSLDIAAAVFLAVAPLLRPWRPGAVGIVAVEVSALAWLRVTTLTHYPFGAGTPASTPATERPAPSISPPAPSGQVLSAIRGLGRMTAVAKSRLPQAQSPEAQSTLDSGARRMGGHVGRLQRTWRRAAR